MQNFQQLSAMAVNLAARKAQDALDAGLGINAVVLATVDGFAVASAMRSSTDASRIAALASSIASIGSVATQEAGLGRCSSLTLNTERGFAVVRHLTVDNMELVLIMVADGSGLLAQVMYQANQFAKELVAGYEAAIKQTLRDMAAREGFLVAGLVELDGGMVWHAEGSEPLCDVVVSTVSDYWRLYRRSKEAFSALGPLNVAMLFHRAGRITVCECGPYMLLVVITELRNHIDWEVWKQDHAHLAQLIKTF